MNTSVLFNKSLDSIPNELKIQIDMSWSISDKLSKILEEKNMTQKDFAKLVGKQESEVCRWLGGTHNFTLKTIAKISSVLDVDLIKV